MQITISLFKLTETTKRRRKTEILVGTSSIVV